MELVKPDSKAKPIEGPPKLCGISGAFAVPVMPSGISRGAGPQLEIQQQVMGCLGERCAFWTVEENECGIVAGMKALVDLKKSLGGLSSFLPKK